MLARFLSVLVGLAVCAQAWEVIVYDDAPGCEAGDDTKYKIFDGSSGDCVNANRAPPAGIQCDYFEKGGFAGPWECEDDDFEGSQVWLNPKTKIAGDNECWDCYFYGSEDCNWNTADGMNDDKCQGWGESLAASFQCEPSKTTLGC